MRRFKLILAFVYFGFGISFHTHIQAQTITNQQSPETIQRTLDTTMGTMIPYMVKMTEIMIEAQLKYAEKPETSARIASFKWNLFEALKLKGFTKEEALKIVIETAPPVAMVSSK